MRSLLRSIIQSPNRLVRVAAYFLAFFAGRCLVRLVFGLFFSVPRHLGEMALEAALMAFVFDFVFDLLRIGRAEAP